MFRSLDFDERSASCALRNPDLGGVRVRPRSAPESEMARNMCGRAQERGQVRTRCAHLSSPPAVVHRIMHTKLIACAILCAASAHAWAAPGTALTVSSTSVAPGEPVLVTVTGGGGEVPRGTANGTPLQFFPARSGYQAVFAVPLDAKAAPISIEVDSVK